MRRLWAAILLTVPAFSWASSFDPNSWDADASFDTASFSFAPLVCGASDSSPTPGTTITISNCPAFAGNITTLTSPTGDTISANGGATTTSAAFTIPAETAFVSGQSMQDTEWGVSGTWTVGDGSTTENITLTIDPADTDGPDKWFGTATTPSVDSIFPAITAAGDEYYCARVSGTSVTLLDNGSSSAAGDYEMSCTVWDESASAGAGQWSATESTAFDSTPPAFSSASIPAAGTSLTVVFDEAATQGAAWSVSDLTATASGGAVTLTYSSGNTTTSHVFNTSRTIEAGEVVTLSWAGTANGLEDSVGNDLAAFSGQAVTNNSTANTGLPEFFSATVPAAGTSMTVVFDENVTRGAGYANGSWTVSASGGAVTLTYSSGDGTATHVYATSRTIGVDETITLAWAGTANGLEDGAGADVAAFSGASVTNNSTADITAPAYLSSAITVAGSTLTITFDEDVEIGAGGNGGVTLSMSGGAVTATYSIGEGSFALAYTLSRTILAGETGTVSYTNPGNGLEDAAGNDVATISAETITNNSGAVAPYLLHADIDATGDVLTWTLNETVSAGAGGSGGATLTCTGGAVTPTYSTGTGSSSLTFTLSRTIDIEAETCTTGYTQPGNGWEDADGLDLATFSGSVVRFPSECGNDATYSATQNATGDSTGERLCVGF